MTPEPELPEPLRVLAAGLNGAGPALPQSTAAARALIETALADAARSPMRTRRVGWRPRPFGIALIATLGVGSAAAAWLGGAFERREAAPVQALEPRPNPTLPAMGAARAALPDELVAPPETPAAGTPTEPANVHAPAPSAVAKPDLLAEANRLRRAGRLAEAERVYREVFRQSPTSPAAYVARVAVAQLTLGSRPGDAVQLLKRAQAAMPDGALEREIRQALANGYRALGQREAERRELSEFISRYPGSPGTKAANERLNELRAP